MFKLENYTVFLKDKKIINNLNLEIHQQKIAIVGSNGAGKSSLALSLFGHPSYKITGEIYLNEEKISSLPPYEKSKRGLFLSLQKPVAMNGISCLSFLREITQQDPALLIQETKKIAEKLHLPYSFLQKSLNAEFSGGEQKKLEIIQMLLLKPKVIILDEIDSGLDQQMKKIIAQTIFEYTEENKSDLILISHQPDFMELLAIDKTYHLSGGELCQD